MTVQRVARPHHGPVPGQRDGAHGHVLESLARLGQGFAVQQGGVGVRHLGVEQPQGLTAVAGLEGLEVVAHVRLGPVRVLVHERNGHSRTRERQQDQDEPCPHGPDDAFTAFHESPR